MQEFVHQKHFTLEEANQIIPIIAPLVVSLLSAVKELEHARAHAVAALQLSRTNGKTKPNSGDDTLQTVTRIVQKIEEHGCIIKDFEIGLVDFPTILEDKEAYFCWKLGESAIVAWHPLDEGYNSRRPLN
jgi:hypothetical protein